MSRNRQQRKPRSILTPLYRWLNRQLRKPQPLVGEGNFRPRPDARSLTVLLHGYVTTPEDLSDVAGVVAAQLQETDILIPEYEAGMFSNRSPWEIALAVAELIERCFREKPGTPYDKIILVGYSCGALLIRKALLCAAGNLEDYRAFGPKRAPMRWVEHTDRVILLAGMNRGWEIRPRPAHMTQIAQFTLLLCLLLLKTLRRGQFIMAFRRGTPFIANLRVQWIRASTENNPQPLPPVVQILGDRDDLVSAEDNKDLAAAQSFIFVPVQETGHVDVVEMGDDERGQRRKEIFTRCLCEPSETLRDEFALGSDARENTIKDDVKEIIFALHGIRSLGGWASDFASAAQAENANVKGVPSSYGYFPMLPFLLSWERGKRVRWFMDRYTEELAAAPHARVGVFAHSNGSYLVASALENYRSVRFGRIVFAGAVVRRDYPWDRMHNEGRVEGFRNDMANKDLIVGIFPGFLEWLAARLGRRGYQGVGSAGLNGFLDATARKHEVLHDGGHSAAAAPYNYYSVTRFLTCRDIDEATFDGMIPSMHKTRDRIWWADSISRLGWVVWLIMASAAVLGLALAWSWGAQFGAAAAIMISAGYVLFIYLLLLSI